MMGAVSHSLSPPPHPEMADELSDAVARFVLEAGGLKRGVYLAIQNIQPSLPCLPNPRSSKGGFEGICQKSSKVHCALSLSLFSEVDINGFC